MFKLAYELEVVAKSAGVEILSLQRSELSAQLKEPGQLVTLADHRSHDIIQQELNHCFPGIVQILEEQDNPSSLPETYLTADELDGTAIYAAGFPDWGVTLALIENGRPVVGVMHQPALGVTVTAWLGGGTWINGERISLSSDISLNASIALLEINRFITPEQFGWIHRITHHALAGVTQATAVGNTIALLRGRAGLYLNGCGAKVWDFAAATLAVSEAGGVAQAEDGGAIDWRRLPVGALLAANRSIADEVLALRS